MPRARGDGGGISLRNRAQELLTWPISLVHGQIQQSPAACSSSPQAINHRFKFSQRENLVRAHSESDPSASPRLCPELWSWPRALWDADPCRVSCHSLCQRCHLSHLHRVPAWLLLTVIYSMFLLCCACPALHSQPGSGRAAGTRHTAKTFIPAERPPVPRVTFVSRERSQVLLTETSC